MDCKFLGRRLSFFTLWFFGLSLMLLFSVFFWGKGGGFFLFCFWYGDGEMMGGSGIGVLQVNMDMDKGG